MSPRYPVPSLESVQPAYHRDYLSCPGELLTHEEDQVRLFRFVPDGHVQEDKPNAPVMTRKLLAAAVSSPRHLLESVPICPAFSHKQIAQQNRRSRFGDKVIRNRTLPNWLRRKEAVLLGDATKKTRTRKFKASPRGCTTLRIAP